MDTVFYVVLTAVITFGLCGIGYAIMKARQSGDTAIPWEKIRPLLSEMFIEAIKLMQAKEIGYEAIENYAVNFLKTKIDEADFLLKEEKEILTEDFIRSIIAPRLRELYAKEQGRL